MRTYVYVLETMLIQTELMLRCFVITMEFFSYVPFLYFHEHYFQVGNEVLTNFRHSRFIPENYSSLENSE